MDSYSHKDSGGHHIYFRILPKPDLTWEYGYAGWITVKFKLLNNLPKDFLQCLM